MQQRERGCGVVLLQVHLGQQQLRLLKRSDVGRSRALLKAFETLLQQIDCRGTLRGRGLVTAPLAVHIQRPVRGSGELQRDGIPIRNRVDTLEDLDRPVGISLNELQLAAGNTRVIGFCVLRELFEEQFGRLVDLVECGLLLRLAVK